VFERLYFEHMIIIIDVGICQKFHNLPPHIPFSVQIKNKGMINMVVYVWLNSIKRMIQFESMQEYHESRAYEVAITKDSESQIVMVDRNTKLWKE